MKHHTQTEISEWEQKLSSSSEFQLRGSNNRVWHNFLGIFRPAAIIIHRLAHPGITYNQSHQQHQIDIKPVEIGNIRIFWLLNPDRIHSQGERGLRDGWLNRTGVRRRKINHPVRNWRQWINDQTCSLYGRHEKTEEREVLKIHQIRLGRN